MNNICSVKIVVCCLLLCVVSACHTPQQQERGTYFRWTDSYGRKVQLDKEPKRIISLSPGITEILFSLGAQDKLVGVSDFCNYPAETQKITKVGGMQNINMEVLLSLHPDVVLIGSIVPKKDVESIEKMHIPVIAIREEKDLESMADEMEVLGKIANKSEVARLQSKQWKASVKKLKQQKELNAASKRTVYYVVGFGDAGDFTAPKDTHIQEIIDLAGGINAGQDLKDWSVSREFLFKLDPDIILVRKEDKDSFIKRYPYTMLSAVKNHKVYPIDSGWMDVVSPRNLMAVEYIQNLIAEYGVKQ